jgi:hypothetical protein
VLHCPRASARRLSSSAALAKEQSSRIFATAERKFTRQCRTTWEYESWEQTGGNRPRVRVYNE